MPPSGFLLLWTYIKCLSPPPQSCRSSDHNQVKRLPRWSLAKHITSCSPVLQWGNEAKIYIRWKFWCMSPQSHFIFIPQGINNRKACFFCWLIFIYCLWLFILLPFISPSDFNFCSRIHFDSSSLKYYAHKLSSTTLKTEIWESPA